MELENLIRDCIKGHELARKHLYIKYGPIVKSICLRYIKDSNEVLDAFHDCFVKIIFSIEKYTFQGSFEGWIKRLAVNFCLDTLKKKKRLVYIEEYTDLGLLEEEEGNEELIVNQAISANFSAEEWNTMLEKLPEHFKIVFYLFHIDCFSHSEIAKNLNIEEKTSRSRLWRAKKLLRTIIEETIQKQHCHEK